MGQKKPGNSPERAPKEEASEEAEENKETSEVRTIPYFPHNRHAPDFLHLQQRIAQRLMIHHLSAHQIELENALHARHWFGGDGRRRTFLQGDGHLINLRVMGASGVHSRQYPCVWCAQPAAELD
jgi:hypothetical protein